MTAMRIFVASAALIAVCSAGFLGGGSGHQGPYGGGDLGKGSGRNQEGNFGPNFGGDLSDALGGNFGASHASGHAGGHDDGHQGEDGAALSAVGLARLLGSGTPQRHHAEGGGGASYTISGPTQEIRSVHKITTTSSGGQVFARASGSEASRTGVKIIFIKGPAPAAGHGGWQ